MAERPILFSGPMVRAILAGRKTQTRRVVKADPSLVEAALGIADRWEATRDVPGVILPVGLDSSHGIELRCPYGAVGDRLWVRETWRTSLDCDDRQPSSLGGHGWPVWYEADNTIVWTGARDGGPKFTTPGKTRVSIHMPRWASRLTLEVTGVRVERLQAITEADAQAEGARRFDDIPDPHPYKQGPRWSMGEPTSTQACLRTARFAFGSLWNSINSDADWDANPWVWVVEFRRVEVDRG